MSKWSRENIGLEIRKLHDAGECLNYAAAAQDQTALLRAATRYFGSWRNAVESAGLNYDAIRCYKTWDRDRIVERIQELYQQGEDLSWRRVSTQLDPQLAAAATKKKHFGSWSLAIAAAGLDYDVIRRYRDWDETAIKRQLTELYEQGENMNAKQMEASNIALITAARRRYESWDQALTAAGLDYTNIVLRAPSKRRQSSAAAPSARRKPNKTKSGRSRERVFA